MQPKNSKYTYLLILTWIIYLWMKRFGSTISNKLLNAHTPFRANISTLSKCRILLRNHSVRASSIHSAHGLRTPREEITFTAWPKIHSHSQIFRYGRNIFCLPHRANFQISLIYAFICPIHVVTFTLISNLATDYTLQMFTGKRQIN